MTDYGGLLRVLAEAKVRFVLVGGAAAIAHGSARQTLDVDVVYARDPENLRRLAEALNPYDPYMRGAPPGLPFRWDAETLSQGLNFTLTTTLGDIDLFGEIIGGGYEQLTPHCVTLQAFGIECLCLGLEHLIRVKRAAGRPRDLEAIAELEALLEEKGRNEGL
ncbi:MAG: hypothetical protein ACYTG0_33175 [Planctomycetota bacterium]|jgi:hypothetical protein